jgi:NAD(P)-dependent dehydrogenase (short-subunit alcohol dehydrogenase family)
LKTKEIKTIIVDSFHTIATNTVGPLIMAKYFSPLLLKGNGEFGVPGNKTNHTAILVNISAKVGSITDNGK